MLETNSEWPFLYVLWFIFLLEHHTAHFHYSKELELAEYL